MQNRYTTGKGLLRKFHELECLRTGKPIGAGSSAFVNLHLDVGEKLGRILHFVDHNRSGVHLQEHCRIAFSKTALF